MKNMDITENNQNHEENFKIKRSILDNFSKLGHQQESVRLKSANNLILYISDNYEKEKNSNELKYALKRFIRGLGASSFNSKQGYYCTLATLFKLDIDFDIAELLNIVESELHRSAKNSDGENADICTGKILFCGAVIRAKLWSKCSEELKNNILNVLIKSSKERNYLLLLGFSFITELLNEIPNNQLDDLVLNYIEPEVSKPWNEQTLDSLYLLLYLKNKYPLQFNNKFFKKKQLSICIENLPHISDILMAIPRISYIKHPIYDLVLKEIDTKLIHSFFEALDNHLKTPNRNRLMIFIRILTNAFLDLKDKDKKYFIHIPNFFTNNFIIQLLGYFRTLNQKQKDPEYVQLVHHLFDAVVNLMKIEEISFNVKVLLIRKLLFNPGTFVFEKITKSKLIQQIIFTMDSEGIKSLALLYKNIIKGSEKIDSENDSERWVNNDRLYSVHLLIKLLNLPGMKSENQWKVEQLIFLMELAFFRETDSNVGRELADSIKTAFFGALDLRLSKLEEVQFVLSQLVHYLSSKLTPENYENILRMPLTTEIYNLWQKTFNIVVKIEKNKKKTGIKSVFLTLFLHMSLQLFNDVKLAEDSLTELFNCYERTKKEKSDRRNSKKSEESFAVENGDDPLWIEVVTDLFLSLLSHNSHLLRTVINSVYPHLCEYMTPTTIHQVLSVLDPESENPLSKNQDTRDLSDNDSDESKTDDGSGSDSEGESMLDSSLDDETVSDKLKMALHQALFVGGVPSDDESIDLDKLSETEGETLDKALGEVFRQYKPNIGKMKKQSKDQEVLTHFRVRVLDLIEIYLDSVPSMYLTLEIMLPLLKSLEFSIRDHHQKPLNNRLKGLLKKLVNLKKFSNTNDVNDENLVELLKSLLDKGTKNNNLIQDMEQQIADCCVFVIKCSDILINSDDTPKKVKKHLYSNISKVLCEEIHNYFNKRECHIPYILFKTLIRLSWNGNIELARNLLNFLFDENIKQFKKSQVLELLIMFYSNQRFLSQNLDNVQDIMSANENEFCIKLVAFLNSLSEEPDRKDIKDRFICLLFNFLTILKNSSVKININWTDLGNYVREYRSHKSLSTDAKSAFSKLCRSLGISNIVQMNNNITKVSKSVNEIESTETRENGNNKKKGKKDKNKAVKLADDRTEHLLNGLDKVNLNIAEINTLDQDEKKSKLEVKKKHIKNKSLNNHQQNDTTPTQGDTQYTVGPKESIVNKRRLSENTPVPSKKKKKNK